MAGIIAFYIQMARINNSLTIRRILDDAGIQTSIEDVPQELASKVVPVLISNPRPVDFLIYSDGRTSTGTLNITTTPTDKDFFITNLKLGVVKDVTNDVATGKVDIVSTINGKLARLLSVPVLTLTAQETSTELNFKEPIKLDRGVNITIAMFYTAGAASIIGNVTAYTVED